MHLSASLSVPALPTAPSPPTPPDISEDGQNDERRAAFSACAYGREGFTCEGLRAGVDACQALGRPKIRDLQDTAVGVDQHVVPLVDRDEKGCWTCCLVHLSWQFGG